MAGSRKAKIRVLAGVALLPIGGGCFVLALGEAAKNADSVAVSLIVTAFLLALILVLLSLGVRRLASEECEVKASKICWLGFTLSPLLGNLVLLELLRDERRLPPSLSWMELSPAASTWFVTAGVVLTLLGMGLIAFDLIRIAIYRVVPEDDPLEPGTIIEGRLRHGLFYRLAPEFAKFETFEQLAEAQARANSDVRLWACFIIASVFIFPLMFLLGLVWMSALVSFIALPIVYAIVGAYLWVRREAFRRSVREELCKVGIPICIKCGYDLRGQVEPRCPECGSPFDANLVNPGDRPDESS